MRSACPPTAFVKQVNRATAESAQDTAIEEGLSPLMEWTVRCINRLIQLGWGTTDYVFAWEKPDAVKPLEQAQIDEIYVKNKIRLVNEVRADHGWEKDPALDAAQMAPPPAPVRTQCGSGARARATRRTERRRPRSS
jgi:hypothetical protein